MRERAPNGINDDASQLPALAVAARDFAVYRELGFAHDTFPIVGSPSRPRRIAPVVGILVQPYSQPARLRGRGAPSPPKPQDQDDACDYRVPAWAPSGGKQLERPSRDRGARSP